jgi:hypothetical protein
VATASVLRGHLVHFFVLVVPMALLVGAIGLQEIRARWGKPARGGFSDADADSHKDGRSVGRPSDALCAAAAGLAVAAAIHAMAFPEHLREFGPFGGFFAALTLAQLSLAFVLTRDPDPARVRLIAFGSMGVVLLWLVSRTAGLPLGPEPWRPESIGVFDVAASCAEAVTALGCVMHLRAVRDGPRLLVARSTGALR